MVKGNIARHERRAASVTSCGANNSDAMFIPWRLSNRGLFIALCDAATFEKCQECGLCGFGKEFVKRVAECRWDFPDVREGYNPECNDCRIKREVKACK